MISVKLHLSELADRIGTIVRILDETHAPIGGGTTAGAISREARGLTVVLLFATYENLLNKLTRSILDEALTMRISNRNLRPGLQVFALHAAAKSIRDSSEKKLFQSTIPNLVEVVTTGGRVCTINPDSFPSDGSFMKRSQIEVWCRLFGVDHPQRILHRTWSIIDTVVAQRNGIAHGRLTPAEVGREYSEADMRELVENWSNDWTDFLGTIEVLASDRDFFRVRR